MTDTSLKHLPSLSEENRMQGVVNLFFFFSPWKTPEEISSLTILSSAETGGGLLSGLLYADTKSICNGIGKKSGPSLSPPAASSTPEILLVANGSRALSSEKCGLVRAKIIPGRI